MITTTTAPRGRGRPKGTRNARKRGQKVRRPLPPLTPDENFTLKEALNFLHHGESTVDKMIREGRFPRPQKVGKVRLLTGAQIIAYRASLARGEPWAEPEQQPTGDQP